MSQQARVASLIVSGLTLWSMLASATHAAPPTRLSTASTATASSELGACCGSATPFFASRAVDGSRDGSSNSTIFHTNDPNPNSFLSVNLGSDYYLDRIQIFPRSNASQLSVENFRIDVLNSANLNVFSKTYLAGDSTRDIAWGTVDVRNVLGNRVSITRLDGSPSFMTFAEFEVFGSNTPMQPNLALGKSITASSAPGFGTTNNDAIDGDINGHYAVADTSTTLGTDGPGPVYHGSVQGVGQTWQINLGREFTLDYLNLYGRMDGAKTGPVTLDILEDDGTTVAFTTALNLLGTDFGAPRYDQTINLTNVTGQFIRLTTTSNQFLAFAEIEAFAEIPEPTSICIWSLAGVALVAAGYWNRRRAR